MKNNSSGPNIKQAPENRDGNIQNFIEGLKKVTN
jgi:hypothetical protein